MISPAGVRTCMQALADSGKLVFDKVLVLLVDRWQHGSHPRWVRDEHLSAVRMNNAHLLDSILVDGMATIVQD